MGSILRNVLLFLSLLESSRCYYYHYDRNRGLIVTSVSKDPIPGFALLRPPKENRRGEGDYIEPGSCPSLRFTCARPFPSSETAQFECDADRQCPAGHKCCAQRCFAHLICSRAVEPRRCADGCAPTLSDADFGMRFLAATTTTEDPIRLREYEAYEYHYGEEEGEDEEEY